MKKFKKVLAVAVVATMALSSFSAFAAEPETNTTELDRPAFSMNMGARKGNFKFGKLMNLTDEQKAAMAEKFGTGEFKFGEKAELTEEQKAAMAKKIASGEFKGFAKFGKGMRMHKAPGVDNDTTVESDVVAE